MDDLKVWRTARKADLMTRQEYRSCSAFARKLARHLVTSRDAMDGSGMFRSPRKLVRELDASESTIRRGLRELLERGVFTKERRTDPRGTGRRDTTSAYRLHPSLNISPGYPLRSVTNDRLPDTPNDTPRSSKLLVEEAPRGLQLEQQYVAEKDFANRVEQVGSGIQHHAASTCNSGLLGIVGQNTATPPSRNEILSVASPKERRERAEREYRAAYFGVHQRYPDYDVSSWSDEQLAAQTRDPIAW